MSEIENGRLGLYDNEHWKSNHLVILGFRGLTHMLDTSCHLFMHLSVVVWQYVLTVYERLVACISVQLMLTACAYDLYICIQG